MIPYPKIDPNIVTIGPVQIRWYGLMYVLGLVASAILIQKQKRAQELDLKGAAVQDLMLYLAIGLIIGARLGYLVFYQYHDYAYYLHNPLEIIATWHGGMSFHGGLIGATCAAWLFCRRRRLPFRAVADSIIVTAPVGLGLGRLGNFINGELPGRPSDVPWAMVFPDGGPLPRHPSQLYEALAEGLILFILMWQLRKRPFRDGMMVALFLVCYGTLRFTVEFFRDPDPQLGFILGPFTMGQFLCLAMFIVGVLLALLLRKTNPHRSQGSGTAA